MTCESHFEELVAAGRRPIRRAPTAAPRRWLGSFSVFAAHGTAEQPSFGGQRPAAVAAAGAVAAEPDALSRREALAAYAAETAACTRCRLAEGRTQVVFGVGDPDADLMFVGEAPGFHEDKQGYPFVGQAGSCSTSCSAGIGLTRRGRLHRERPQVPAAGQPRPAAGRDRGLRGHLFRQLELIQPKLVATLGNFATKLLARQAERDHARARPAAGGDGRRAPRHALPALPPGGRALHARRCCRRSRRTSRRLPELLAAAREAPALQAQVIQFPVAPAPLAVPAAPPTNSSGSSSSRPKLGYGA